MVMAMYPMINIPYSVPGHNALAYSISTVNGNFGDKKPNLTNLEAGITRPATLKHLKFALSILPPLLLTKRISRGD